MCSDELVRLALAGGTYGGKEAMSSDFFVCDKSIFGGSGPVIGFETAPGLDCEPSSRIMGSLITRYASVHRSPDNFYRGIGWMVSENFGSLLRNMVVGEILNSRAFEYDIIIKAVSLWERAKAMAASSAVAG